MRFITLIQVALVSLCLIVPGCKIVKNADRDAKRAAAEAEADVVSQTVTATWVDRVIPHIQKIAVPMVGLAADMNADLNSAGVKHGYRQESEGSPWNFAARISGKIVAANTKSKAASADVDIDGDGSADVTVQLGPVIRGTTLRDILPFINFTDFRDQIEFAKLARAYNATAYETVLKDLPRDALPGASLTATGVFTMRSAGAKILITPIEIAITP